MIATRGRRILAVTTAARASAILLQPRECVFIFIRGGGRVVGCSHDLHLNLIMTDAGASLTSTARHNMGLYGNLQKEVFITVSLACTSRVNILCLSRERMTAVK